MSIADIGNWLGSQWGGFTPWGRFRRIEAHKSDLNAHKLRKGLIYRTFGGSDIALMLNIRPSSDDIVKNISIYHFRTASHIPHKWTLLNIYQSKVSPSFLPRKDR